MGWGEVRAPSALSSSPSSLLPTQDLGGSTLRSSHNQKISPSSFHDLETILCLSANVPGLSDVHPSQSRESAGSGVITGTHHCIRRAICSGHREKRPQGMEDHTVPGATHSCPSAAWPPRVPMQPAVRLLSRTHVHMSLGQQTRCADVKLNVFSPTALLPIEKEKGR